MAERRNWTREELLLALYLYFQLPFGKLHSRQPNIVNLAQRLGRSPSAVAMKLVNLASLDPSILATGRSGLGNASALDREVWQEFKADWQANVERAAREIGEVAPADVRPNSVREPVTPYEPPPFKQPTTRLGAVELRIGQQFFRNAVLANFENTCSLTGISELRVLVASHIRPWSVDQQNRLNPSNGLCFSATLDRAFDAGLITVSAQLTCMVSRRLVTHQSAATAAFFLAYEGKALARPQKIALLEEALNWHRTTIFVDSGLGQ